MSHTPPHSASQSPAEISVGAQGPQSGGSPADSGSVGGSGTIVETELDRLDALKLAKFESQGAALHDVSNALTAVLGWLERAVDAGSELEKDRALDIALRQARRGFRMARAGLGVPQLEGGDCLHFAELNQEIEAIATAAAASRIKLYFSYDEALDRAIRDAAAEVEEPSYYVAQSDDLLRIVENLLRNAAHFSPDEATLRFSAKIQDEFLCLRVQDEGPGVSEEIRARLFQEQLSRRSGGAGIGLFEAAKNAQRNGAELKLLDSSAGACFELRWPLYQPRESGARWSRPIFRNPKSLVPAAAETKISEEDSAIFQPKVASLAAGKLVYLLEDDVSVADLVELGLGARGYRVEVFREVQELLEALAKETAAICLLDKSPFDKLPEESLAQVEEELASWREQSQFVWVSGSVGNASAKMSADTWLRKPFSVSELNELLLQLLAEAKKS